jgi:hypothetical protein
MSSQIVSVNGIEIFLREQGEGPLMILCHGWPELAEPQAKADYRRRRPLDSAGMPGSGQCSGERLS